MRIAGNILKAVVASNVFLCLGGVSSQALANQTLSQSNTYQLEATALIRNRCGVTTPSSQAFLLVHNRDFSLNKFVKADQEGNLTLELEQQTATVTLVNTKHSSSSWADKQLVQSLELTTFVNAPVRDLGEFIADYGHGSDGCECVRQKVRLTNTSETEYSDSSSLEGHDNRYSSSFSSSRIGQDNYTVTVCREPEGQWPTLTAMMTYHQPYRTYSGELSSYDPASPIDIKLNQPNDNIHVDSSKKLSHINAFALVDGQQRFYGLQKASQSDSQIHFVETPATNRFVVSAYEDLSSLFSDESVTPDLAGGVLINNSTREYKTKPANSADLAFGDAQTFLTTLNRFLNDNSQYDFSSNTENDAVIFEFSAFGRKLPPMLSWKVHVPPQGALPDLNNLDLRELALDTEDSSPVNYFKFSIASVDSLSANGYENWLKQHFNIIQTSGVSAGKGSRTIQYSNGRSKDDLHQLNGQLFRIAKAFEKLFEKNQAEQRD